MMSIIRNRRALGLLYLDAPPLATSLAAAEFFFKFGTFTMEALAFLGLWFVLGVAHVRVLSWLSRWTPRIPAPEKFYA